MTLAGTVWYLEDLKSQAGVVLIGLRLRRSAATAAISTCCVITWSLLGSRCWVMTSAVLVARPDPGQARPWTPLQLDAAAAMAALRSQPMVDEDAVGLFGHSEGGWGGARDAPPEGGRGDG